MTKVRLALRALAIVGVALAGQPGVASAKKPGPPVTEPFCGNGIVNADRGEQCDGGNLAGKTCGTLGGAFDAGVLTCDSNCKFDTSGCTTCDNGRLETGEVCEPGNLQGHTCRTDTGFGFGTLVCGSTCTSFDSTDCHRFEQDELTVTDSKTRLMWQRTTAVSGIANKDNQYSWTNDYPNPNGSVFTEFLATLNGLPLHTFQFCSTDDPTQPDPSCSRGPVCFAGYCDWRLPEPHELLSIVDADRSGPAIDTDVFGPSRNDFYWTATVPLSNTCFSGQSSVAQGVWTVFFFDGQVDCSQTKETIFGFPPTEAAVEHPARAVRYVGGE